MSSIFSKAKDSLSKAMDKADEVAGNVSGKIGSAVDGMKSKTGFVVHQCGTGNEVAGYLNNLLDDYKEVDPQIVAKPTGGYMIVSKVTA